MEKNCNDCNDEHTSIRDGDCPDCHAPSFKYWKPIEKEPAMKHSADDYEILRDCTLDTLIEKNACPAAVEWYVFGTLKKYGEKDKLQRVIANHPEWLEWLIHEDIIKKVAREPKPGEVWEGATHRVFVIEKKATGGYECFDFLMNKKCSNYQMQGTHWKRIYTKEQFLKLITGK